MNEEECPGCNGTGDCQDCAGEGVIHGPYSQSECRTCDGTGDCQECDGTGHIEED